MQNYKILQITKLLKLRPTKGEYLQNQKFLNLSRKGSF
jgi:hypothetical protein